MIHAQHTTKKPLQKKFLSSAKVFYNPIRFRDIYNSLYMSNLPTPPMTDFSSQPREVAWLKALFVFAGGYHIYLIH